MDFFNYFNRNYKSFLELFIFQQIKNPLNYSHENNIEIGVGFEKALCIKFPDDFKYSAQGFSGTKRDVIFKEREDIELKTGYFNFSSTYKKATNGRNIGDPKNEKILYRKQKSNSSFNTLQTLPDALLIYQKFNIAKSIPAGIGFIPQSQLISIYEEKRFLENGSEFSFYVNINDFKEFHFERKIPQMKEGYSELIRDVEENYKKLKEKDIEIIIKENMIGYLDL